MTVEYVLPRLRGGEGVLITHHSLRRRDWGRSMHMRVPTPVATPWGPGAARGEI